MKEVVEAWLIFAEGSSKWLQVGNGSKVFYGTSSMWWSTSQAIAAKGLKLWLSSLVGLNYRVGYQK